MEIIKINRLSPAPAAVAKMAEVLGRGGLVVAPTGTVYAVFADALNRRAVNKVLKLKRRGAGKGFILTLLPRKEIFRYARPHRLIDRLIKKFPGEHFSFVLPRKSALPAFLNPGFDTVAFHFFFSGLDRRLFRIWRSPLIGTSANISAMPEAGSCRKVMEYFGAGGARGPRPDLVLDAGAIPRSGPSAVVELNGKRLKVLRAGKVPEAELQAALDLLGQKRRPLPELKT